VAALTITSRSIDMAKYAIRFRESGAGRALILVHGFGHSSTAWLRTMPLFAAERRAVAPDLPDFNRQTGPAAACNPTYFASVLVDFIERLNLGRVDLVGSSLGGLVAMIVALERPNLVRKLVLADPAGFTKPPRPPLDDAVLAVITFWLSLPRPRPLLKAAYEASFYDRSRADEETVDELVARMDLPQPSVTQRSRILHDLFRFCRDLDGFHTRLSRLQAPSLVVWGKNDPLLPVKDADIARRVLPGARIEVLERCGHMPHIELPEVFASLVLDFLDAS
jgi:4,5:9,10-diseco-3-hydroxy-5,9,17-trioxoandrosta-1(10),2-diene-4-oate hydrolase